MAVKTHKQATGPNLKPVKVTKKIVPASRAKTGQFQKNPGVTSLNN